MILLALKMLFGDRLKYFGLVAGMTFAATMIAQQASILVGFMHETGTFIRSVPTADLWVMDEQVRFSEDQVPMPQTALARIRSIEGVEWAVPMYKSWLPARLPDGTRLNVILVGIDDASLIGGPSQMVEGSLESLRRDGGILINAKDASKKLKQTRAGDAPLTIGDRISVNDHDAIVVGSFDSEPSFFWEPVAYTTYTRALTFAPRMRNLLHLVLVKCKDGVSPQVVQARIEATTSYKARSSSQFLRMTMDFIIEKTGILINFGLAIGLGLLVGMLVTGQTFFNFTLDNLRYFGALKALGTSTPTMIAMIFMQVVTVTLISFGLGIGVAALVGLAIQKSDLAFQMPWQIPALTLLTLLGIAFLAGCLSLAKVLRLEPAVVFRGA